jgi:hypothetical protein
MKQYLKALYQSFGNPAFYSHVIYRWVGSGFLYLLVVATVLGFLAAAQFSWFSHHFNQTELPHILKQVPDITLSQGVVQTTVPQPYTIKTSDDTDIVTIDLNAPETELSKNKSAFMVSKDYLLVRQMDNDIRRVNLSDFKESTLSISQQSVEHFFHKLPYTVFLVTPFLIFMQWLVAIVQAVTAACLSYIVTAFMPEEYNFETRIRIAAIAITPTLLISKLLQLTLNYSLGFWIMLSIWTFHLYLIVLATRFYIRKHPFEIEPV